MPSLRMPSIVFGANRRPRTAPTPSVPVHADIAPDLTRARPRTALDEDAKVATALFRIPQRRGVLPEQARAFSDSNEWLRAAINRVKDRVARSERMITPVDPALPFSADIQAAISYLIENPNPRGDSWRTFIEPVIEDLCTLGRGGWEYVPNWQGWPIALYPYNAQFMSLDPIWDGSDPRDPRYYWTPMPRRSIGLRNDEVTMMILNPRTDRPDGLGWVDTLKDTIEADAAGNEFVRSLLKKYPPPGWLNLGPTAGKKQVEAVSERLNTDVLGQGGMLVTGGLDSVDYKPLWVGGSRENELMAWSHWFGLKVAAVVGISPQDIGLTMDINKANGQVQERLSSEGGYRSMLLLVQEYVNREIIGKFGPPEQLNLHFTFRELTQRDRAEQIRIATEMAGGLPVALYNEARAEADLPPLEMGNAVYVKTMEGAVALIGEDADAYHRQAQAQQATEMDLEAQEKGKPSGKEKATPNKTPAKPPADGGNEGQSNPAAAPKGTAKAKKPKGGTA